MKKDVLVVGYKEVFDKVACKIIYQNEEVLKRGQFEDEEIGVHSRYAPLFPDEKTFLNIRGIRRDYDDHIIIVFKEEAEMIKEKVRLINEKYGIEENWKAKEGEEYWYISSNLDRVISVQSGKFGTIEAIDYKVGNYFKTKEQAEEALKRIGETLKQYHKEIGE